MESMASSTASTMGITHVVLFQFKPDVSSDVIKETCNRILELKDNCVDPETKKPYLKSIMGGKDNSIEGVQNGLTHCFVIQLENAKDREYYVQKDPAHKDFMHSVEGLVEQFIGVDFTHGIY